MNGKWSTAVLGITAVVALGVGFFVAKSPIFSPAAPPPAKAPSHMKAVLNRNSSDNSCQQYAGPNFGNVVKYAFPVLAKGGHTIVWHGQVDGGSPNQKVEVQFPSGKSPFSKDKFDEDQDSGPIDQSVAMGDYPFATVTVGGTPCSKFTDPGVHVN